MKPNNKKPLFKLQRGQSLVEVALFFPIFIIMLAGLVEVANLLVTQNRVTSATRASTRFAADGGLDAGMTTVVLNTVTQTLNLDNTLWDIWSIRGQVDANGTAIDQNTWQFTHIYGISNTVNAIKVDGTQIQQMVLDELRTDEFGNMPSGIASDLQFVGTFAIHDVDSILGLDTMPQFAGFTSIEELTVMRLLSNNQVVTNGCDGFPIAVEEGIRSATPPGTGTYPYPQANEFFYPQPPPSYGSFIYHDPDIPLLQATEGDLFRVQNGTGSGGFGWLVWNEGVSVNANRLNDSLSWPGDGNNYTTPVNGGQSIPGYVSPANSPVNPPLGYVEPGDPTDTDMNIGDWVRVNTGAINSNGVRTTLNGHIDNNRALRLIVYDHNNNQGQGNNLDYKISGFAIFRLKGYDLSSNNSWILAEFVNWDNSCGQVAATP